MNEAQPLEGKQVTLTVRRGPIRVELHGRLQLAGHVGVLLASGDGLGLFPWHTVESIFAVDSPTAAAGDQLQGMDPRKTNTGSIAIDEPDKAD